MPADLQPLPGHSLAASDRSGYDRSLDVALAEMPSDVRHEWRERYIASEGAEATAEDHLRRAEAALQAALRPATIRAVWMLVADRAGAGGSDDMKVAAALAGMAMGLRSC